MKRPNKRAVQTSAAGNPGLKIKGIYKRGSIFWLRKMVKGVLNRWSLDTEDEMEAISKAAELLTAPELEATERMWAEAQASLRDRHARGEISDRTTTTHYYALKEASDFLGDPVPAKVTTEDITAYRIHLSAKKTRFGRLMDPQTVNSMVMRLQAFFTWLVEKKKLRTNPCKAVTTKPLNVPGGKARVVYVEYPDFEELIDAAPTDELKFILYCGFHCGMRKDEIINARAEWFDLKRKQLVLLASPLFERKNGDAPLIVPLSDDFIEFLRGYGRREPYMIAPGNPMKATQTKGEKRASCFRYDYERPYRAFMASMMKCGKCTRIYRLTDSDMACPHCQEAGVEFRKSFAWVSSHVMRHTFVSNALRLHVDLATVAKWIGDSYKVTFDHYAHLIEGNRDAINKVLPSRRVPEGKVVAMPKEAVAV